MSIEVTVWVTAVTRRGSADDVNTNAVAAESEYSFDIIMIVLANDKKHAAAAEG